MRDFKTDLSSFSFLNEYELLCPREELINQQQLLFEFSNFNNPDNTLIDTTTTTKTMLNQTTLSDSDTKSPEISDYTNLFRGYSVQIGDAFNCLDQKPDLASLECSNTNTAEKTLDLADLLVQQQHQHLPNTTTLAQLNPVQQLTVNTTDMSECSMDSQSSFYSPKKSSQKITLETNVSSPQRVTQADPTFKPTTKRGRKPATSTNVMGASNKSKFSKQVLNITEDETKTLVFFGNKKVEIGTPEYETRRRNNNEAVKKCREKSEKEQREREENMKKLSEENSRLTERMNTMAKEMDVLKGIIISMRPDNKLPEYIQTALSDIH